MLSRLQDVNSAGSGFWLIASSNSKTEAGDGAFVRALETVLRNDSESFPREEEFPSLDRLVESINQYFEQTGQAQRAIASGTEIQSRARFILNPRFVPLQNANQLLPVLEQFDRETLNSAYCNCYPESIDSPFPEPIEALLRTLIKLPQGMEERLPKFVSVLIQNESLASEQRQALKDWGSRTLPNFEAFQTQVGSASTEFYLMVYVSGSRQSRDRYTIRACLMGDRSTTQLPVPGDEDGSVTAEQISLIVADLVDDCAQRVAIKNLSVQCFLPKPLLHLAIDQAELEIDGTQQKIGSVCKTLVVRSSERQRRRSASHGNWNERWGNACWKSACQGALILHQGALEDLYKALEDYNKIGCLFEGRDDPDHTEMFEELFLVGVPIALWLRPGHPFSDPYVRFRSILTDPIEQLPTLLTRERQRDRRDRSNQPKITHHVTLLWDNPLQSFPDDDWQGRSA